MKRPKFEVLCYQCDNPIRVFTDLLGGKFCSKNCAVNFAVGEVHGEYYCSDAKAWSNYFCGGGDSCGDECDAPHFEPDKE